MISYSTIWIPIVSKNKSVISLWNLNSHQQNPHSCMSKTFGGFCSHLPNKTTTIIYTQLAWSHHTCNHTLLTRGGYVTPMQFILSHLILMNYCFLLSFFLMVLNFLEFSLSVLGLIQFGSHIKSFMASESLLTQGKTTCQD